MKRVAIVEPVRTAVGAFGGTLRPVKAEDLAAVVIKAVVERTGIDPARIDDVAFAQGSRVRLTFRRLFSAGGVANYFWKAQQVPAAEEGH